MIKSLFIPFESRLGVKSRFPTLFWLCFFIGFWSLTSIAGVNNFPSISDTLIGISQLYADGLAVHIGKSLALFFKALSFSVLVSLLYSFLSPLPFFKPLSTLITKLRYLPLAGITFYLTMLVHDARNIQVYTLMIFTSTFLTTSIISTINSIPQKEIDHARSLGCSRWETLYQLVIIGRIDMLLECIRQNLAIITMMLVTVESLLASVGGIGFLIKNQDKQMNHGKMLALQLIILLLGVGMDAAITGIRKLTFRYTF